MSAKRYRLLQMPFLSFFSKRLYRDVGFNWSGANFAYLFLLLAICCIPATTQIRKRLVQSMESGQVELINQIPDISIQHGRVSTDSHRPQYIRRKDGSPLAIIDTTGSMNYIADDTTMALLTESKLIVRYGRNHFNTFDLSGVEKLTINKYSVNGWLQTAKGALAPLSYGIFLMLTYVSAVLTLLLAAVLALAASSAMHHPLRFTGALRIATAAATPSIIFMSISAALGLHIPAAVYGLVTILYLGVGITVCNRDSQTDEDSVDLMSCLHEEDLTLEDAA